MAKKSEDQTALINEITMRFLGLIDKVTPDEKIVIIKTEDGILKAAKIDDRNCLRIINEKQLYIHFLKFTSKLGPRFMIKPSVAEQVAKNWFAMATPIDYSDISSLSFKSEGGYCWNRVDFDPEPGPTPVFDEFCERLNGNAEAFKAYTGSIFIKDAYRQQYLILYGAAGSGKGSYLQMLDYCLSGAATPTDQSPRGSDKHFFSNIYQSRLVYFDDFEDIKAFSCGKFKMATGGLPVPVDPKGQQAFKAKMDAAWVFTMNDTPSLRRADSDLRRAIICKVQKPTGDSRDVVPYLIKEAPAIAYKCMELYKSCGSPIPVNRSSFDDVTDLDDSCHLNFWSRYFIIKEGESVSSNTVVDRLRSFGITGQNQFGSYYRWLEDNTNCYRKRANGKRRVMNLAARANLACLQAEKAEQSFYDGTEVDSSDNVQILDRFRGEK